jgi:hypothetical protein
MSEAHNIVKLRDAGICAACGLPIFGNGHIHHRQPRGMGGSGNRRDTPANMIHVHETCHRTIESHRESAVDRGWIVLRGHNPAETPILYRLVGPVLLNEDGTVTGDETETR